MTKKLTLSIDEVVIDAAKAYAESQDTSLSNMAEIFFRNTTGVVPNKKPDSSKSENPHVDAMKELRKKMRSQEEQKKYLVGLYISETSYGGVV